MPPVIAALPLIAEVASIGTGAVGIGEALTAGGGSPTTTPTPTASSGTSPQDMSAIVESIRKQFPDFQANTGGALGASGIADVGSTGAGHPGDMNAALQAVNAWLGQGLTGTPQTPPASSQQTPSGGGGSPPGFNIQQLMQGLNRNRPGMTLNLPF